MPKFYRVKKDTPLFKAGAILEEQSNGYYKAISDVWDNTPDHKEVYTNRVVGKNDEWFEQVYDISILGKVKYLVKDAAQKAYESLHETGE